MKWSKNEHVVPNGNKMDTQYKCRNNVRTIPNPDENEHSIPNPDENEHPIPNLDKNEHIIPNPDQNEHTIPNPDKNEHTIHNPDKNVHTTKSGKTMNTQYTNQITLTPSTQSG